MACRGPDPVQPCALLAAGPDGKHGVRNHYLTFTDDASGIPPRALPPTG